MTDKEIENIKYRLTDIGGQVGELALNYINELEKEISVLLSCANCAENKGGYICDKEYNDKIENLEIQIEQMKCKPDKETITDWLDRYQQENKTYYLISESRIAEANKDGFLAGVQAALGYINEK